MERFERREGEERRRKRRVLKKVWRRERYCRMNEKEERRKR